VARACVITREFPMDIASNRPDTTNPSIFLRLKVGDEAVREVAWHQFYQRWGGVIAGFARQLGASAQDTEDIVQDVLIGFYATSPRFVYDPARGRFRGYLKTCTCHVVQRRAGRDAKFRGLSLKQIDPDALEVDQVWNDVWEQEELRRAVEQVRDEIGTTKTFQAFEMYVIQDIAPTEVSRRLGLHIDNVYRSKESVTQLLRKKLDGIRAAEH
jgi:RNA polymerase sigma factor (sigma-70 family)